MTSMSLPRGYSLGTRGKRFVFTWVETAEVPVHGGPTEGYEVKYHTQISGRMSETYATPESAAEAAREHASLRGA